MAEINDNKIIGNRDVTININEQNNIGKKLGSCTNDELYDEEKFRLEQKSKRSKHLWKANRKWFIWLAIGIAFIAYVLRSVWLDMGQTINLTYIANITVNLVKIESESLSKILSVFVIPFSLLISIALPARMFISNLPSNDRIYLKHVEALIEINEILQERGER